MICTRVSVSISCGFVGFISFFLCPIFIGSKKVGKKEIFNEHGRDLILRKDVSYLSRVEMKL